jgi:hypothetical protein
VLGGPDGRIAVAGCEVEAENRCRCPSPRLGRNARIVVVAETGRAELSQALDVVVAVDQSVEPGGEPHEGGRAVQAMEAPNAGPGLDGDRQAEDFPYPIGDGDLKTALCVDQLAFQIGAGGRIVVEPEAVLVVLQADHSDAQQGAETMVIPQQRSYPRKQPVDDLAQLGHAGGIIRRIFLPRRKCGFRSARFQPSAL